MGRSLAFSLPVALPSLSRATACTRHGRQATRPSCQALAPATCNGHGHAPTLARPSSAETTSVKFEAEARDDPTKPWLAANVTAIAVTGGTFANSAEFLANNGSRTDGVQLEALELLASNAITFTTTLFNCTATDLPWNAADPDNELDVNVEGYDEQSSPLIDVEVATLPAQLWVQREARLRLVYTGKRDYDTFDMPIPVGCDVPFEYSFDVFNEGPSCVENLVLDHAFELATDVDGNDAGTATGTQYAINTNRPIYPNELGDCPNLADEAEATITVTRDAVNSQLLHRHIYLVSPNDNGIITADSEERTAETVLGTN